MQEEAFFMQQDALGETFIQTDEEQTTQAMSRERCEQRREDVLLPDDPLVPP